MTDNEWVRRIIDSMISGTESPGDLAAGLRAMNHCDERIKGFTAGRRQARSADEIFGMMHGVMCDGVLADSEIFYLASFLVANGEFINQWPFNVLCNRISEALEDGIVTEEERDDLTVLIKEIIGSKDPVLERFERVATALPLTKPIPQVIYDQNEFVFTGKFVYGSRRKCCEATMQRGGHVADDVRLSTRYLVIGMCGSENWVHTSHGRKIEKAVQMSGFGQINIITEQCWQGAL